MIVRYPEVELNTIYNNMYKVVHLGEVARFIPGYYSRFGRIFKLIDCEQKGMERIEGFSLILRHYVTVEQDAVRPLITEKDVEDFKDADCQRYSTYLITADHNAEDFYERYPLTAKYLTECIKETGHDYLDEIETAVRPSIREAMDKMKLILTTTGNISHAMMDEETHVVPTVGSYLCTFPEEDRRTIMAYMAILNSKTFSYLLHYRLLEALQSSTRRMAVLEDMPVPRISKDFAILQYLSEYLLYLTKPDLPQITKHISNEQIGVHLTKILDMVVYEMYFPEYVHDRNLNAIEYLKESPLMTSNKLEEYQILETYQWFQRPDNVIRQMIGVLDTRSPELLYKIHKFDTNE